MNTYDVDWDTGAGVSAYYSGCERGIKADNKEQALKVAKLRVKIRACLEIKNSRIERI